MPSPVQFNFDPRHPHHATAGVALAFGIPSVTSLFAKGKSQPAYVLLALLVVLIAVCLVLDWRRTRPGPRSPEEDSLAKAASVLIPLAKKAAAAVPSPLTDDQERDGDRESTDDSDPETGDDTGQ